MNGSRAGRSLLKRRYPYILLTLLVFLVVLLVCGAAAPATTPSPVGQAMHMTAAVCGNHVLAIKSDGSLWGYGVNDYGALGLGNVARQKNFIRLGTDSDWVAVAAGTDHSLAIKADGSLWAAGRNNRGQLGDGTGIDRTVFTRIGTDNDWAAVSASWDHSLAIKNDGSLWGWGENDTAVLGDGTHEDRKAPVRIGDATDWASVSTGCTHTLALKADGSLWAWGKNAYGEVGNGSATAVPSPTRIGSDNDWTSASAGVYCSFAMKSNGALCAWGNNTYGQLGDGTRMSRQAPDRTTAGSTWKSVTTGGFTTMGVKDDGSLWQWGWHDFAFWDDTARPERIGADAGWLEIHVGIAVSVGLKTDGSLWFWATPLRDAFYTVPTSPNQYLSGVRLPGEAPASTTTTTTSTPASTTTTTVAAKTFTDVPATHPYYPAISAMAARGIIGGYPDGSFGVDKEVLRKHFAKMIVGGMGLTVTEADWQDSNPPFTDCGPDDAANLYPHDFIAVAKAHGLTAGKTASTFAPEASITKAQMVTMVVRAAQSAGITLKPLGADYNGVFKDFNDPNHGANVHLAEYNGLLQGILTGINPSAWITGNATRGEVAQVLWNLMQLVE